LPLRRAGTLTGEAATAVSFMRSSRVQPHASRRCVATRTPPSARSCAGLENWRPLSIRQTLALLAEVATTVRFATSRHIQRAPARRLE
jgi:hypothetical protein